MIATLSGVVSEKLHERVVLDVKGVGFGLFVTTEDYGQLSLDKSAKLYIYEYIREQSYDLYAFLQRDTQLLFEQLLSVSGVGPKMALSMLSIASAQDLKQAIAAGEVKFLQQASGVGRRVAERVVVELKDKVGLVGVDLASTGMLQSGAAITRDEALEALVSLGYSIQDASKVLQDIDDKLPSETRVKKALQNITK